MISNVVVPGQFALSVVCARATQATRLNNAAIHLIIHLNQVTSQTDPLPSVASGCFEAAKIALVHFGACLDFFYDFLHVLGIEFRAFQRRDAQHNFFRRLHI